MEIIAITVCVNYDDILKFMLEQNSELLKHWYIVTSPEDSSTKKTIEEFNRPNVTCMIYDGFKKNGALLNKGGAVHFVQQYIYDNFNDTNILILDADILLPEDFISRLPQNLELGTLYGIKARYDYDSLSGFILNNTNPTYYPNSKLLVGFFQLYKQNNSFYKDSRDCAVCDLDFRNLFKKRINLDVAVKHLGEKCVNWGGRVWKLE